MREWLPPRIRSVDEGWIPVERRDSGLRPGALLRAAYDLRRGTPHTVEAPYIPPSWRGMPHVAVGRPRLRARPVLRQLIPFGQMATALQNDPGGTETNRLILVQFEQAGYTLRQRWLPPKEQTVITASFMEWCQQELGIPERYPYDLRDVATGTWATETNPWRRSGKFLAVAGWHPHIAVPENDHWDCGGEDLRAILAKELVDLVEAFQIMAGWEARDGHRVSEALSPHFGTRRAAYAWFVKEGELRQRIRTHLRAGHQIRMAERRVEERLVAA